SRVDANPFSLFRPFPCERFFTQSMNVSSGRRTSTLNGGFRSTSNHSTLPFSFVEICDMMTPPNRDGTRSVHERRGTEHGIPRFPQDADGAVRVGVAGNNKLRKSTIQFYGRVQRESRIF